MSSTVERASLISGLRDLADFLEANQGIPNLQPQTHSTVSAHLNTAEQFAAVAPLLSGAKRAEIEGTYGGYLVLEKSFGPFRFDVWTPKKVAGSCRVETRPVEIFEYPDFVPGGAQ